MAGFVTVSTAIIFVRFGCCGAALSGLVGGGLRGTMLLRAPQDVRLQDLILAHRQRAGCAQGVELVDGVDQRALVGAK